MLYKIYIYEYSLLYEVIPLSFGNTLKVFFVSLITGVVLRTVQLCFAIDSGTGFIKQQYKEINTVIMVVIFLSVLSVGLISFCGKIKQSDTTQKSTLLLSVASFITCGAFVYDVVASLTNLSNAEWHGIILLPLGILSAVTFAAYGLKCIYKYDMPMMMLLIPSVYYVIRLVNIFVSISSLARTTENVFIIFTNGILLLFVFEFAKFENGVDLTEKQPKKIFAVGLMTVVFCAVSSLPKIIFSIVENVKISTVDLSSVLLNIAIGFFIYAFTVTSFTDCEKIGKSRYGKHLN